MRQTRFRALCGACLVASFIVLAAGAVLYLSRSAALSPQAPVPARVVVERSLIWGAIVLAAAGFLLLERLLVDSPGRGWRRAGAWLYCLGGMLGVTAEMIALRTHASVHWMLVSYVVLGFLGQAAIGAGLARSKALSPSVGWFTVAWSLGWLAAVLVTSSLYIPALHHVVPLVIGGALLSQQG
jgi:hypothetical protein